MKKTISFLLALLMLASLMTGCAASKTIQMEEHSVPLDDLPDGHEEASEPELAMLDAPEQAGTTEQTGPAGEAEPATEETEVTEVPEVIAETEVVSETEAEPTEEPEPEPEVEVTEEPKAEPTEVPATEEPKAEPTEVPATEEPKAEPTEVPATEEPKAEPTAEPEPEEEPEADEAEIMSVGMDSPMAIDMDDADPSATAVPEVTYVTMDCNGGNIEGVTQFPADVLDGKLVKGFNGFNDRIRRDGYRFLGWFTAKEGGDPCEEGMDVKGATTFYAHWVGVVTLDAEPGNFTGKDQNYTRTVDLDEGKMPTVEEQPVYDIKDEGEKSVAFKGWYTQKSEVTTEQKEGYKTWSIKPAGEKVNAGDPVEPGTVLYAGYQGKSETKVQVVTYYYDYNGVNGQWGHCLTSSRNYDAEKGGYALTAEDLLVRYLNWNGEDNLGFTTQEDLTAYWAGKSFNGYIFKGWATSATAEAPNVEVGHVIHDGDSIYAVWEKDGSTSKDFDRTDPEAGPVTGLRQEGVTGNHNSGTMTWSTHAKQGNSIRVSIVSMSPARATYQSLVWTVSDGKQTIEVKLDAGSETATATLGDKIKLTAQGKDLVVEYIGKGGDLGPDVSARSAVVTVNVKAVNEDGSVINNTGIASTAQFTHNFNKGEVTKKAESCKDTTDTKYTCTDCGAYYETHVTKNHVFSDRRVIEEPTCTEKGEYQYFCSVCEAEGGKGTIPALGHDFKETSNVPSTCNKNEVTKVCQRDGCGVQEVSMVPASNPSLHVWKEYDRVASSCKENTIYERCGVCGKYQNRKEPATNEHSYAFVSRTPVDCQHSMYTFECVYGCGTKKAELRKELNSRLHSYKLVSTMPVDCGHSNYTYKCTTNGCSAQKVEMKKAKNAGLPHSWGSWKETKKATEFTGGTEERTCSLCGAKQTRTTAKLVVKPTATAKPAAAAKSATATKSVVTVKPAATAKPAVKPVPESTEKPVPASEKQTKVVSNSANAATEAKKLATPTVKIAVAAGGIKVTWNKVSGAPRYMVYYRENGGSWHRIGTTTATSYTRKAKDLKDGVTYQFTVRCVENDKKTMLSSYKASNSLGYLAAPEATIVKASNGGIKVSWNKVNGAPRYMVYYRENGGSWHKIGTTTATSYTRAASKLKSGVTYQFTVRCVKNDKTTMLSGYTASNSLKYTK